MIFAHIQMFDECMERLTAKGDFRENFPLPIIDPRYEWSIFSGPRIQTLPSLLLIGLKNVARGKSWQNLRDELQNIANVKISQYSFFVNTLINTPKYIISVVEPTIIKYIRCYIYKPRINFIKNGLLKKLLKLYQLYQSKARFPYILLLLLLTFLELYIYFKKVESLT